MTPLIDGKSTSEFDIHGVGILSNASEVLVSTLSSSIHLLGVHTILRMQVLDLTARKYPVKLVVDLELCSQLCSQSQALLLPGELQQIRAGPHDGSTTGGQLKNLLLAGFPCDYVKFLHLRLAQKTAGAASKDGGRGVSLKLGGGEACRSLGAHCHTGGGARGVHAFTEEGGGS